MSGGVILDSDQERDGENLQKYVYVYILERAEKCFLQFINTPPAINF